MTRGPLLSVVAALSTGAANVDGRREAGADWLSALVRACVGMDTELLLVGPAALEIASRAANAAAGSLTLVPLPMSADALVPELWGRGLAAATAPVVAFTTDRCIVGGDWARAIFEGLAHGHAGVGGRLEPARRASLTDRAIYHLRYSAFLLPRDDRPVPVRDVPGDNAAYRRAALLRHPSSFTDGFWEVEAHRAFRVEGQTVALVRGMAASFAGAGPLGPLLAQRFAHGRHSGAWRVRTGARRRWQIVAGAPLVPFVLLARSARAANRSGAGLGGLARAAVPFLLLACAWAAGEAAGAAAGWPRAPGPGERPAPRR